jgi:DUF1680 family protein
MRSRDDDGLVAVSYAPATINTHLLNGHPVSILVNTSYPFSEDIYITVDSASPFPLSLRIPNWVNGGPRSWLDVDGKRSGVIPGNFSVVKLSSGKHKIKIHFDMPLRTARGVNNSAILYRG